MIGLGEFTTMSAQRVLIIWYPTANSIPPSIATIMIRKKPVKTIE
tara:strand:- start:4 stop:138 length:135 start_codon:yes stop_codon:yes gene_type:complete